MTMKSGNIVTVPVIPIYVSHTTGAQHILTVTILSHLFMCIAVL